jgi:hypothetical protein
MAPTRTFEARDIDVERLLDQIARYLAAVDEFRRQGCEPHWRPEALPR